MGESQEVVAAMKTLPAADRELLMLSAWEQLTPAEIAITLDVSSGVVRKRLFRARKRMAEAVGEVYEDHAGEFGQVENQLPPKARPSRKGLASQ